MLHGDPNKSTSGARSRDYESHVCSARSPRLLLHGISLASCLGVKRSGRSRHRSLSLVSAGEMNSLRVPMSMHSCAFVCTFTHTYTLSFALACKETYICYAIYGLLTSPEKRPRTNSRDKRIFPAIVTVIARRRRKHVLNATQTDNNFSRFCSSVSPHALTLSMLIDMIVMT